MAELVALKDEGLLLSPSVNGCRTLKASPASAVGDNYASDTYVVTAVLDNGSKLQAFIKVF